MIITAPGTTRIISVMQPKRGAVQILYSRPYTRSDPKPMKTPVQRPPSPVEKFENRLLGPTKNPVGQCLTDYFGTTYDP
jgi:hypothetical protein